MRKAENCEKDVFISFWKLLTEGLTDEEKEKLLIYEDKDEDNLFYCALLNTDHETFLVIKDLYMKTFKKDKIMIMLMKGTKHAKNILCRAVSTHQQSVATLDALWKFIQEICDVAIQKTVLLKAENFYGRLMSRPDFNETMQIFDPFIENNFTELEKMQFKT